jgi:DNA-directed RNA polymerases I, II, and III subunit RPABC2
MAEEDDDYEINDYEEDETGFLEEENNNNSLNILSYDEIIEKNKNTKKKTVPFLNKFEKARLLGVRIQQLSAGAEPKINISGFTNIVDIVEEELKQRKIPLIIKRNLPNGTSEEWKLEEFEKV